MDIDRPRRGRGRVRQGRPPRFAAWLPAAAAGWLCAGCMSVSPDYHAPAPDAPPAWSSAASAASDGVASRAVDAPFDAQRWWRAFDDPLLDRLIEQAAAQNLDVQSAALRIAAARTQRLAQGAASEPQISGNAVAGRARMSQNGVAGALGGGSAQGTDTMSGPPPPVVTSLYQAGFDATWELDLWSGVRRGIEAADASVDSAVAARQQAIVSLEAEVAREYTSLRGVERRLAIAREETQTQQHLVALVGSLVHAGFAAESEVVAQRAALQGTRAQIPALERACTQGRDRLALLLAQPPGALDEELAAPAVAAPLPPRVPVGLPGDLLRRRPDVRQAESELHAATARIGVARASLFPTVTLGLSAGLQATRLADLRDWASRFALGGAAVSLPIFEGGRLRAQVRLADLGAQQAALDYRRTVLTAVHEADDALVAYGQSQRREAALADQLDEARRGRELALGRWRSGLGAYLEVLDAERTFHRSQDELAQGHVDSATGLIGLYKALGGSWN